MSGSSVVVDVTLPDNPGCGRGRDLSVESFDGLGRTGRFDERLVQGVHF